MSVGADPYTLTAAGLGGLGGFGTSFLPQH